MSGSLDRVDELIVDGVPGRVVCSFTVFHKLDVSGGPIPTIDYMWRSEATMLRKRYREFARRQRQASARFQNACREYATQQLEQIKTHVAWTLSSGSGRKRRRLE